MFRMKIVSTYAAVAVKTSTLETVPAATNIRPTANNTENPARLASIIKSYVGETQLCLVAQEAVMIT
jgi:hypothetical protein